MDIAIFGGTGRTGRRVIERVLARGDGVRALARDPARLPGHARLVGVRGDATDADAVNATVRGTSAIVVALGMADIGVPSTTFSDSVRGIVAAAKAAGIRRIMVIASAGALADARGGLRSDHEAPGPYAIVMQEHARNYRTLSASGLDWTLMCPVNLVEDMPEGRARWTYEDLPAGSGETGYEDLAATIVALLQEPESFAKRVGIVSLR